LKASLVEVKICNDETVLPPNPTCELHFIADQVHFPVSHPAAEANALACNAEQILKMKGLGLSDEQVKAACPST
jgi:hypothetical protein